MLLPRTHSVRRACVQPLHHDSRQIGSSIARTEEESETLHAKRYQANSVRTM